MATMPLPKLIHYPSSDGKPMAETSFHVKNMSNTLMLLTDFFKARNDVCVKSNILVYYVEGNPKARLSPDVFVTLGVSNHERDSYKVWEEGRFPDLVIEFTSRKTRNNDLESKFEIYRDVWKVREYFLFDPKGDYLKQSPTGFRLMDGEYVRIEPSNGRLESEVLGFTLERRGVDLLFRDAKTGEIILLESERKLLKAEQELKDQQSEIERLRQLLAAKSNPSSNGH
jgi:Uma2 family endonuclease